MGKWLWYQASPRSYSWSKKWSSFFLRVGATMAGCWLSTWNRELVPQRWAPTIRKPGSIRARWVGWMSRTKVRDATRRSRRSQPAGVGLLTRRSADQARLSGAGEWAGPDTVRVGACAPGRAGSPASDEMAPAGSVLSTVLFPFTRGDLRTDRQASLTERRGPAWASGHGRYVNARSLDAWRAGTPVLQTLSPSPWYQDVPLRRMQQARGCVICPTSPTLAMRSTPVVVLGVTIGEFVVVAAGTNASCLITRVEKRAMDSSSAVGDRVHAGRMVR